MSEGKSLVNFGDLSKPATILIEKVSSAVGILYEPTRIRKKAAADADADADKIRAIAHIEVTEIQQRAIERMIYQEGRKQENIERITAQAAQDLPQDSKPENLDEDWIAHFFSKCENVSDEQMQSLWSKLLAGEATSPGTYSKRTVDLVGSMDKKDAFLFTELVQFTWMMGEAVPLIFDTTNEIYTKKGINFSALKHLDSLGLISFESVSGYIRKGFSKQNYIFYFGLPTLMEFSEQANNQIATGQVIYTQAGKELIEICGCQRNQEFYEYAIERLGVQNLTLSSRLQN